MPAWGLIPDSPIFYWAGKGIRAARRARRPGSYAARASLQLTVVKLVIYKPILNFELNDPRGMVGNHMHALGRKIMVGAKAQVGVKTGRLRDSIYMEHRGIPYKGQTLKIGSGLSYAYMHHQGTRPHIITPKEGNAGALVFRKNSRIIYTKQVLHPGTKANRYLSDQLRVHVR